MNSTAELKPVSNFTGQSQYDVHHSVWSAMCGWSLWGITEPLSFRLTPHPPLSLPSIHNIVQVTV